MCDDCGSSPPVPDGLLMLETLRRVDLSHNQIKELSSLVGTYIRNVFDCTIHFSTRSAYELRHMCACAVQRAVCPSRYT